MSLDDLRCRRCDAPMQAGFLLDMGDNNLTRPNTWIEGRPENSRFLGMDTGIVKTKGHVSYTVLAYRCPQCAGLELFAPAADTLLRPASGS